MSDYTVYFTCFGKKLKATVKAGSEREAERIVKDNIHFVATKKCKKGYVDVVDDFIDAFMGHK